MSLQPRQVVMIVGDRTQVVPLDPRPTCTVKDLMKKPRRKKQPAARASRERLGAAAPVSAAALTTVKHSVSARHATARIGTQRGRRRVLLLGSTALLLLAVGAAGAIGWRPSWYAAEPIDRQRLEEDKRDLAELLSGISDALNAGRPADVSIDRAQLNRWLAARRELWPEGDQLPSWLSEPRVGFEQPDRVQVGGLLRLGVLAAVLSVEFSVRADSAYLYLNPTDAAVGSLPITAGWALTEVIAHGDGQMQKATIDGRPALKVLNEWVWPNGKVPFCVQNLRITPQRLSARLEPLRRR